MKIVALTIPTSKRKGRPKVGKQRKQLRIPKKHSMRPQSAPTRPPPPPPGLPPRVPPHGAVSVRHLPSQIPSRKRKVDDNYPTGKNSDCSIWEIDSEHI